MFSINSRARLATGFLPLIVLLAGCHSATSYLQKGNTLFEEGQFAGASLNYRKAMQKDPTLGEAYYRAGLAELKQNKGAEALQDLQQAVRLMPNSNDAKRNLTNLMLGAYVAEPQRPKFLYDLLVKYSGEWLAKNPNSAEGLRIKGYLAMLEQRPEEAVDVFRRAHDSNPKDEKMTLSLMDALFRNKQPEEAEKVGLASIRGNPPGGDVYDALYRLYSAAKRSADAENILVRKVSGNPKEGAYVLQLASYYAIAHKQPEMDNAMRMFLSNPSGDQKVHLKAGDFYAAIGDWTNALRQYKAGLGDSKDKLSYQNRIARALLSQGKREEALNVLSQALSKNPDDKEAGALRAGLLLNSALARPGEAIQQFQALAEKNPDDLFLKFVLSKAQLEIGNLAAARTQLLEIVQRNPHFLDAQISLAEIAFRQGNSMESLQHAEAALEIDPANFRAQLLLGRSLLRVGNLDQAATVLGNLSRQAPNSVDVMVELARLDIRKRKFPEAEAAFNKIRASYPDDLRALAGLVDIDFAQNRPEKALALLDQEAARSHGAPQVLYLMAVTALRSGKYGEAINNLQRLADKTPGSIDPQLELASVFRLKGDYRHAIATLQKAALLQPKDPRPTAMLPYLLEMDNQRQEAKALARRALRLEPNNAAAMNNLAYLLAETGDDLDQALKLARQAANKSAGEPYFSDTLAYIYLRKDQNEEALQIFERLVRGYPNEPIFLYHLGMTYFQKGDVRNAKATLTHALQLRPPKDVETGITDLMTRIN
jgi:tetratricopeptide (TPR) repeat protein